MTLHKNSFYLLHVRMCWVSSFFSEPFPLARDYILWTFHCYKDELSK